jgi:hypothetical protein
MTARSFGAVDKVFNCLNFLPEWAAMLIYSMFGIFIIIGINFYNFLLGILTHFSNLQQYFRGALDKDPNTWESANDIEIFSFKNITKILMFWFVWWWVSLILLFLNPIFVTIYTLIAPLFATYKLEGSNDKYNFLWFIIDAFIYKKTFIIFLATFSLLSSVLTYLGSTYLPGAVIGVILLAVFVGIFNPAGPSDPTETPGLTKKIVKETEPVTQTGGKKYKKTKTYNVRLV